MASETNKKVGAALVIGGGGGGMQPALDLAEAGIRVYLPDSKSSIRGMDLKEGREEKQLIKTKLNEHQVETRG